MGAEVDARNAFNVTPLMVASHRGAIKAAELLVENGADVMLMNDQVRPETVNPWPDGSMPRFCKKPKNSKFSFSKRPVGCSAPRHGTLEPSILNIVFPAQNQTAAELAELYAFDWRIALWLRQVCGMPVHSRFRF